jgi:hypothetical protein
MIKWVDRDPARFKLKKKKKHLSGLTRFGPALYRDPTRLCGLAQLGQPNTATQYIGVGIGGIGTGRRVFAYRPDVVGEVGNFTDLFPTTYISSDTVTGTSVTVIG